MKEAINGTMLPLLPIKSSVLFPGQVMRLTVGRNASVAAVEAALAREGKNLCVVCQRDPATEEPGKEDLFSVGTIAVIKNMFRNEQGMAIVVLGIERFEIGDVQRTDNYLSAEHITIPEPIDSGNEVEATQRALMELVSRIEQISQPEGGSNLTQMLSSLNDPVQQVFMLANMLPFDFEKDQKLLESRTRLAALRMMHDFVSHEVEILEIRQRIASEAETQIGKEQRDYVLRQQLKAIQQELGDTDPEKAQIDELRERIEKLGLSEDALKDAKRELARMERLPTASSEYQVARAHLELVAELPWNTLTEDSLDLSKAKQVLDEDHFDLQDVKQRIIEHLAIMKLNPEAKAPILCFVGPPGVGKTSLGESIAKSLGRKFHRMSLGGLHDEAELRGHRRTYIGSMPGRIIQAIRRAGCRNPVIMLDEVDKLGRDFRGDPASALMEILDPAQNKEFRDNYLDMPFDLSKVLFIATANTLETIPGPLLDRLETIRLSGYSDTEKLQIARRYLLGRQLKQAGLSSDQIVVSDGAILSLIRKYTREAGVRELERMISSLVRKLASDFADGKTETKSVDAADLSELLGPERFFQERARKSLPPGVATGLAWTQAGGDVLYIEAAMLPGMKGLTITGQLGDVMKESAKAAKSYVFAHADELGVTDHRFLDSGLHIHVPAGAVPKDGPSAGITMATALSSLLLGTPTRTDTAMTGEMTLTGLVLPIGGVKEKVLAAHRSGLRRVILPIDNRKDMRDLPPEIRNQMEFIFVERIEDALDAALMQPSSVRTLAVSAAG